MKTNRWRDYIGAVINVEASGTGGPGKLRYRVVIGLVSFAQLDAYLFFNECLV